jgi:hypothetical protein
MPLTSRFKSFAHGFSEGLFAIYDVLKSRRAPSVENVRRAWTTNRRYDARYRDHYLGRGGKVEHAIAALLWRSETEHEILGDGEFFEVPEWKAAVEALPRHPKDDDYRFIGTQLLGSGYRSVPYEWDGRDDGDEDGEESGAEEGGGVPLGLHRAGYRDSGVRGGREQSASGWEDWPLASHADWRYVYVSSLGIFGYYDDDADDSDDEKEEEEDEEGGGSGDERGDKDEETKVFDPLCIVYVGAPLLSQSVDVRLSCLRVPPKEGALVSV